LILVAPFTDFSNELAISAQGDGSWVARNTLQPEELADSQCPSKARNLEFDCMQILLLPSLAGDVKFKVASGGNVWLSNFVVVGGGWLGANLNNRNDALG
jgi:hypothetical protein